jgi:hypothetical protein
LGNLAGSYLWHSSKKKGSGSGNTKQEAFSKGHIIAVCGVLGLDWRITSMSAYFEALEAYNDMQTPEGPKEISEAQKEKLRKFNRENFGA